MDWEGLIQAGEFPPRTGYDFELDPFRNKLTDRFGEPMPEPVIRFKVWDHLIDLEEESFVRGDIKNVNHYISDHGVVSFMKKTQYKYSLGCILIYKTVADAQKSYVSEQQILKLDVTDLFD